MQLALHQQKITAYNEIKQAIQAHGSDKIINLVYENACNHPDGIEHAEEVGDLLNLIDKVAENMHKAAPAAKAPGARSSKRPQLFINTSRATTPPMDIKKRPGRRISL